MTWAIDWVLFNGEDKIFETHATCFQSAMAECGYKYAEKKGATHLIGSYNYDVPLIVSDPKHLDTWLDWGNKLFGLVPLKGRAARKYYDKEKIRIEVDSPSWYQYLKLTWYRAPVDRPEQLKLFCETVESDRDIWYAFLKANVVYPLPNSHAIYSRSNAVLNGLPNITEYQAKYSTKRDSIARICNQSFNIFTFMIIEDMLKNVSDKDMPFNTTTIRTVLEARDGNLHFFDSVRRAFPVFYKDHPWFMYISENDIKTFPALREWFRLGSRSAIADAMMFSQGAPGSRFDIVRYLA